MLRVNRDLTFDAIRGVCIVSMVTGHIASESPLRAATHFPVWVDGAMGFVLLSGLIVGLVYKRIAEARGTRGAAIALLRRTRTIYICHLAITILALAVGATVVNWNWTTIFEILLLSVNPPLSILGMYVVYMLLAIPALALFRRGLGLVVLLLSFTVYVAAQVFHVPTALPGQAPEQQFQLALWQLLFFGGMWVGWNWRMLRFERHLSKPAVVVVAAIVFIAFAGLAHVTIRMEALPEPSETMVRGAFDKLHLGPGAVLYTAAAFVLAYALLRWFATTRLAVLAHPIEVLGARSLDSYVISTAVAIVAYALTAYDRSGWFAMALSLVTLALCYVWARYRIAAKGRRKSQLAPVS